MILHLIKKAFHDFMAIFGVAVVRKKSFDSLSRVDSERLAAFEFLLTIPEGERPPLLGLIGHSKSQNAQDLFVLHQLKQMRSGYFVEFGATNGVTGSNTMLLESEFGWRGILAEPAKGWHKDLVKNRPHASIEMRCIWSESGVLLEFAETENRELSTLSAFAQIDHHSFNRESAKKYTVETISLHDLLEHHRAPKHIDYLSIDTEGSEFEILSSLDFSQYSFGVITCEHNFTESREKIHDLLIAKGYIQIFPNVSKFDDWYVSTKLLP